MVILIFIMTLSRVTFMFTEYLIWAEECARYMMIWMAFIAIGPAAVDNLHFRLTAVVGAFKGKTKRVLEMIATVITLIMLILGLYYGTKMVLRLFSMGQTSPILKCPMWVPYLSIPIGMTDMIVRTIRREFFRKISNDAEPGMEIAR
jgi:C4-dicarboxylate transporter DctQ subunit